MKKVLVSVLFAVSSVLVAGLCYAAWSPVVPVAQPSEPVPAPKAEKAAPVLLESSAVLVLARPAQEAPKARPVSRRPRRAVDCSNAKHREVEQTALGTQVRYCHD